VEVHSPSAHPRAVPQLHLKAKQVDSPLVAQQAHKAVQPLHLKAKQAPFLLAHHKPRAHHNPNNHLEVDLPSARLRVQPSQVEVLSLLEQLRPVPLHRNQLEAPFP